MEDQIASKPFPHGALQIAGQKFPSWASFIAQMEVWKSSVPDETYNAYLDEGANALNEASHQMGEQMAEVMANYYELARKTRSDFQIYSTSARYKQLWGEVGKAAENRATNEAKRDRSRKDVRRNWKHKGSQILALNGAFVWTSRLGQLARALPDFDQAMIYLNRAIYERRLRTPVEKDVSLIPGGTDVQIAIDWFKKGKHVSHLPFKRLVLDECHWLKKDQGAYYNAIKQISAISVVMLSGIMLRNRWTDVGNLMTLLQGHPFTTKQKFLKAFSTSLPKTPVFSMVPDVTSVQRFLKAFMFGRPSRHLELPDLRKI